MTSDNQSRRSPAINAAAPYPPHDPRYQRDCTLAVDASVESLVVLAVAAGWVRQNVIVGIIMAAARQLGDEADFERLVLLHDAERPVDGSLQ